MKISDEDLRRSVRWFSRQQESAPFFEFLNSVLTSLGPIEDTCALHRHEARRTFAHDLIAMAEADVSDGNEFEPERRNGTRTAPRKSRRHGPAGR